MPQGNPAFPVTHTDTPNLSGAPHKRFKLKRSLPA